MGEVLTSGSLSTTATGLPAVRDLGPLYADAMEATPDHADEDALQRAYEIGRQGIARGIGLLELATIHHEVLARALKRISKSSRIEEEVRRAGKFFIESLSPYEMAHRGFSEAVCALRSLNETMEREIQRIAHSVHNEAGQLLDAARLAIAGVGRDASPSLQGGLYAAPDPSGFRSFAGRYRTRYNGEPVRTATLTYDAVALVAALARTQGAQRFAPETLTNPSGFAGIDGLFRFRSDGTNERGLAVMKVTTGGGTPVAGSPKSFGA